MCSSSVAGEDKKEASAAIETLLECQICFEVMFEPSTTTCGHSFCWGCLETALQHSRKCPLCRTNIPSRVPASNSTLSRLIEELVPAKYAARRESMAGLSHVSKKEEKTIGLFVLDHLLPRQLLKLHVFEPRYRRLVSSALESNPPTFGIVGPGGSAGSIAGVATECEIVSHVRLHDGRYVCEVRGLRRCRVVREWEDESGYKRAAVENCCDSPVQSPEERAMLDSVATQVAAQVGIWCDRVRSGGWERTNRQLDALLEDLGPLPPLQDSEEFSMWVAALINPVPSLGVAPEIRLECLTQTNTLVRLACIHQAIRTSNEHIMHHNPKRHFFILRIVAAYLGLFGRLVVLACAKLIALPLTLLARLCAFNAPQNLDVPLRGFGQ